jgi:hypothetical protein
MDQVSMKDGVVGLGEFGLTQTDLRRLGDRRVGVTARIDAYRMTPAVVSRSPRERQEYLNARASRWVEALARKWPSDSFSVVPRTAIPTEIRSVVKARDVLEIAKFSELSSVCVTKIAGMRKRRRSREKDEFFCVRARVAIQVEGSSRGYQSWEDRFVLVRASGFEDAERRLEKQWRQYAAPYINPAGELVRWKLEKVLDVYATRETEIDPEGTEVYSKLGQRRMRREYEWRTTRR